MGCTEPPEPRVVFITATPGAGQVMSDLSTETANSGGFTTALPIPTEALPLGTAVASSSESAVHVVATGETLFSIAQQYLIVGWGGMFPFLGWDPAFARDHTPRFPVEMPPPPEPGKRAAILTDAAKTSSADRTSRQAKRGRQS